MAAKRPPSPLPGSPRPAGQHCRLRGERLAHLAGYLVLLLLASAIWAPRVPQLPGVLPSSSSGPAQAGGGLPFSSSAAPSKSSTVHAPAALTAVAEASGLQLSTAARGRALVVYVYGGRDPEYPQNLRFFISEAVKPDDGCDYIIVLQQGPWLESLEPLPMLPPNARYLRHPNECFDIGTVGWVLDNHVADLGAYSYFVWLNPSVRGPFMPAYLRGQLHWTEPLLSKLSSTTKLVGATINCAGGSDNPAAHVQSYVVATDRAGLEVLQRTGTVFRCWADMNGTIEHSEIGASVAILAAGYGIDSLMLRYQGIDWREPAVRQVACNGGKNPLPGSLNDGISVDPLEVMFVKVKAPFRDLDWPQVAAAIKYSQWVRLADEQAQRHAAGLPATQEWWDALAADGWGARRGQEAASGSPPCFDWHMYIASSPDLDFMMDGPDPARWAWEHFRGWGMWEGRPYHFTC